VKVNVLGGGPAGLYFSILARKRHPGCDVTVLDRDGPDDTFGWGIVFSDRTLEFLAGHDAETHAAIRAASETWDDVATVHRGERIAVRGNGFSGIARLAFLKILRARAEDLGVKLALHTPVADASSLADADLLVGADGASSLVRQTWGHFFHPSVESRQNRYVWLGTTQRFDALSMIFRRDAAGLYIAHAYRFSPTHSTFIVECPPETWQRAGLDRLSEADTCAHLARVFADDLRGHPLLSNGFLRWLSFPLVRNRHWVHDNVVLVGDAAHTAHFSIGSGTKLALEDAIALADALFASATPAPELRPALAAFEATRKPVVDRFQAAAYRSLTWLEDVDRYLDLEAIPFTYRVMTRSGRVGYNQLVGRDPEFIARYDAWRGGQPADPGPIPAAFLDLFARPTHAHLATLMPDGTPHVTPVWVDWDGRHVLVNSAAGRQKDLNMARRREVAIEIPDPDDPNRYLQVRGPVVEITETGADEHLDRLARRYLGRDRYPDGWKFPGEVRRIYKIAPRKVTAWNPFA
jgi:anthraniloyl-CoA monooxygenase